MRSVTAALVVIRRGLFFLVVGIAAGGLSAEAAILDQEFDPNPGSLEAHNGLLYRAQTFTVGKAGKLAAVAPYMGGIGSSTFEIWPTAGGIPFPVPTQPLATTTLNYATGSTQIRDFVPWDVSSANIQVQVGDVLAIVQIGNSHTGTGSWWGVSADLYSGGAGFTTITTAPTGDWMGLNWDLGFQTYVEGVPEPAALLLSAFGLTVVGMRRRSRWRL